MADKINVILREDKSQITSNRLTMIAMQKKHEKKAKFKGDTPGEYKIK